VKLIAISLSSNCVKSPRCSFCYNLGKNIIENTYAIRWTVYDFLKDNKNATLSFEYSGYNLGVIDSWEFDKSNDKTMTTMPMLITPILCGYAKEKGISAISISYDNEKVKSINDWIIAGAIVKQSGLKLSCNYLITEIPFDIPNEILDLSDQVNLLILKPNGKISDKQLKILRLKIELYRRIKPITVDNCLGVQLGFIYKCMAGIDFIHITPDGKLENCCFKENCYLYNKELEAKVNKGKG
jgi:hypothetical protein